MFFLPKVEPTKKSSRKITKISDHKICVICVICGFSGEVKVGAIIPSRQGMPTCQRHRQRFLTKISLHLANKKCATRWAAHSGLSILYFRPNRFRHLPMNLLCHTDWPRRHRHPNHFPNAGHPADSENDRSCPAPAKLSRCSCHPLAAS